MQKIKQKPTLSPQSQVSHKSHKSKIPTAPINRANAQSRRSGILFAPANGKLCFEYLKTFSVPENHLPLQGVKNAAEVGIFIGNP